MGVADTSRDTSRARVLLVEDEPMLRELVAGELAEAGYAVIEAETGEQALTLIRERWREIDILFTDIRLPGGLDGWNLAFEFRYLRPHGPVVYATAYAPEEKQVFGSVFLRKPYRMKQVVEAFETLAPG